MDDMIEFIKPVLGNIATFFTVNMGDMETFAVAVPRAIAGVALYLVAAVCAIAASFFRLTLRSSRKKEGEHEGV